MEVVERGWHSKNLRDICEKIINCGCVLKIGEEPSGVTLEKGLKIKDCKTKMAEL